MRTTLRLLLLFTVVAIAAAVWLSPLRTHLTREEIRATVESGRDVLLRLLTVAALCISAIVLTSLATRAFQKHRENVTTAVFLSHEPYRQVRKLPRRSAATPGNP
jgi:hypothetical protein